MHVTELFSANAGDEIHQDANWQECDACGYDIPCDYPSECPFCGAAL